MCLTFFLPKKKEITGFSQVPKIIPNSASSVFHERLFLYADYSPVGTGRTLLYSKRELCEVVLLPESYEDIGDAPVEYLRLYDEHGHVVPILWKNNEFDAYTSKDEYEIDIPEVVYKQMQNRVFVHNHPNALSFSPQDWGMFDLGMIGMSARANRDVFWKHVQSIHDDRDNIYHIIQNLRSQSQISDMERRALGAAIDFVEHITYDAKRPAVDFQIRIDKQITRKQSRQYEREFEDLQLSMIRMFSKIEGPNRLFIVNHVVTVAMAEKYQFPYVVSVE